MHGLHLTQLSELSLTHLEHAQNTYVSLQLGKSYNTNIFYNKMLNTLCTLLNTALKVKIRMILQVQIIASISVVCHCDYITEGATVTAAAQHYKGVSYHVSQAWEKIKLKNLK